MRECRECGNLLDEYAQETGRTICGECARLDELDRDELGEGDFADEI